MSCFACVPAFVFGAPRLLSVLANVCVTACTLDAVVFSDSSVSPFARVLWTSFVNSFFQAVAAPQTPFAHWTLASELDDLLPPQPAAASASSRTAAPVAPMASLLLMD